MQFALTRVGLLDIPYTSSFFRVTHLLWMFSFLFPGVIDDLRYPFCSLPVFPSLISLALSKLNYKKEGAKFFSGL